MDKVLGGFFRGFNRVFHLGSKGYGKGVGGLLARKSRAVMIYGLLLVATVVGFQHVPPGFVPIQDKMYLVSFAQLSRKAPRWIAPRR